MATLAEVRLWGRRIAAISLEEGEQFANFQYDPTFVDSNIEISPLVMPLNSTVYSFPALPLETFHGLPGLLADSLPDRYGHALIDAWLATQGRTPADFNSVERLCYVGSRGMGALEFVPMLGPDPRKSTRLEVDTLVALASAVLSNRNALSGSLASNSRHETLDDILKVGTSAGGARAKAIIAWNPDTNEVRSGQVPTSEGFSYWLLKFDGVHGNRDKELEDPRGYTVIEYAYSLMASAAGIEMEECRLLDEGGRRHFMTRRFDRTEDGARLHMQTLGALAHLDYNSPGAHSYEQAFDVIRRLSLSMQELEQQFRRMLFNVVARNQDDHVKNIAFLMDKGGNWSLSPAFDVTYAYNPDGLWTARHQMTINGKQDGFRRSDFRACEKSAGLKRGRADALLDEVREVVSNWRSYAAEAGVSGQWMDAVEGGLRLEFPD